MAISIFPFQNNSNINRWLYVWGILRIQAMPHNNFGWVDWKKKHLYAYVRSLARAKREELANELIWLRLLFVTTTYTQNCPILLKA